MTTEATFAQQSPDQRRWRGQHLGARLIRVAVAALPTILATVTVLALMQIVPSDGSSATRLGWNLWVVAAGFVVASATTRFSMRLLPLAALLRLSLVFPDRAPSRLRLAARAASSQHLRSQVAAARHHGLSEDATEAAGQVLLLTTALGEHDRRTRGHSERVRLYARMIGEEMGIGGDDLERLQWGALLHDVGKLTIPAEILNKPGSLGPAERAIMSGHAAAGTELVEPLHPFLGRFVAAADGHHERWDGSGYPLGLRGTEIPIAARIVAVADAYEVMTAARPYKKPISPAAARVELAACAGTQFDPAVVRAWLRLSVSDVNRAAGPAAVLAALPLIGDAVTLLTRAASQIASVPAAAATLAPAVATAGAMTVATIAAPLPAPGPEDLSLKLSLTTSRASPTTTEPPEEGTGSTTPSTTTGNAAMQVASTETTIADTTAPTTTVTSTTAPSPPDTLATNGIITDIRGPEVTLAGPLAPSSDLSSSGPYGEGSYLFQDPAVAVTAEIEVDGAVIPAGTTVCVHLFLTSEGDDDKWRIDYRTRVLALTRTSDQLAATDWLSADAANYGNHRRRGLGEDDQARITRHGTRVHLDLEDGVNSVRIFLDCSR